MFTPIETSVLKAIASWGPLSLKDICLLFDISKQYAYRIVQILLYTEMVKKVDFRESVFAKKNYIYKSTIKGLQFLNLHTGLKTSVYTKIEKKEYGLAFHDYAISKVFMDFVQGHRPAKQGLVLWQNTYLCTSLYTRDNDDTKSIIIPDAIGRFAFPNGEIGFHLELERRQFSINTMKKKLLGYNKVFRKYQIKDPVVLLMTGADRVARVQKAVASFKPNYTLLIGVIGVNPILPLTWLTPDNRKVSLKDFCQYPNQTRTENEYIRPGGGFV